ncbi:MAG: amidohydrolase family protein [Fimbriimonadaceae bacterium]|nr:amidohydrolase family protein [Fimbriimonadaceae bacterium]
MIAALLACAFLAPPQAIAIRHVAVIQPGKPEAILDQTVIVEGDKIISIGPSESAKVPANAEVVEGKGKYLMPGLWDMHVHLADEKTLPLFTANGVTGIRVMFGNTAQLAWRQRSEKGETTAPRMVLGGPIVDGPKPVWPGSIAVGIAEQARTAVQNIKKAGYDFVKVYSLLSRESFFAIADECKEQKIPFAGHVPHSVGIIEAMNAGQKSSEHEMGVALECSSKAEDLRKQIANACPEGLSEASKVAVKLSPEVVSSFDPKKQEQLLKDLASGPMWHCPTLIVLRNVAYLDDPNFGKDPRLKYVSPFIAASWDPTKDFRFKSRTAEDWERSRKSYQATLAFVSEMIKSKVPIIAGTDCLNPYVFAGFSLHDELELLVQAGMKPADAIATATLNAAKYFGLENEAGTVASGKRGDLVLLDANPLSDIRNTTKIAAVIQRGKLFDRAALDSLLKGCEYAR